MEAANAMAKTQSLQLAWQWHLGQAELEVMFQDNALPQTIRCSTLQMLILQCFNLQRVLYCHEIRDLVAHEHEFERHLLSLAHPVVGVLLKRPNTKNVSDNDKCMINPKFHTSSQVFTVKMLIPQRETSIFYPATSKQ